MKKITLLDRLSYTFDNFMAKGTIALVAGLAAVSAIFIVIMAAIVSAIGIVPEGSDRLNFGEAVWTALMRALDSGAVGGDTGWSFRLLMLLVTFGGIFLVSILIGLLTSGIEDKLQQLRKGRSRVIETDHTVILGWSLQVYTLLSELILANANRPDSCIVILSEEDKVVMEDTIAEWIDFKHRTRIVCRTGNPTNMADLGTISLQTARSIIVLNAHSDSSDINLIKTLLAIVNIPRESLQPYHIVAQVNDPKSLEVIEIIGGDRIETLLVNDLISRIIVQTCRQSGLSAVYMDLFDFSGNEIYFRDEPSLVGQSYGQALIAYENSAVIGIKHADGKIELNPPAVSILERGTELITLAEDDDTSQLSLSNPQIDDRAIVKVPKVSLIPESTLILGWNDRVPDTIAKLDPYVVPGSKVTVVANFADGEAEIERYCTEVINQSISYHQGEPTKREVLESLSLSEYDRIIVLCDDRLEPEHSDAQTLVTLLQLRNLTKNSANASVAIVTEMLDPRNQSLAQVAKPDDFVISEQIVSRLLAQIAEQKMLNRVFAELFSPEGAEIYLKPIANYVELGKPINFYTVVEAAKRQGESAIGYRLKADASNSAKAYGIVMNPNKSDFISFAEQDRLIVVAEN